MVTLVKGLLLGEALDAVLAALGKSAVVIDGAAEPLIAIDAALATVGLTARSLPVEEGETPRVDGLAALLEMSGGHWLPLLPRPGGGHPDLADQQGGLDPLPEGPLEHKGRVFLIEALVEQPLVVELGSFLRRNRKFIFPIVIGGLVSNLLALALPLFGSFVYDKVLNNGVSDTLWAMALGVTLGIAMDFCSRSLRVQLIERVAVITEGDIDRALFRNLLRKSGGMPPVGMVLDKYKQTLASRDFISSTYLMAAADLPFLLLFLWAIAFASGPLVLVPILLGVVVVGVNLLCTNSAREYENLSRKAGEQRVNILVDVLMTREAVVTSSLRDEMARRWRRMSDAAAVASGKGRFWNAMAGSVNLWGNNFAYIAIMVGGAYLVEDRLLTSGGMMAASMLTSRCMATIGSVVLLSTRFREFRRALRELDAILPAAEFLETPTRPTDPSGEIQLLGLTWRPRADTRPVLQGLDMRIHRGEIIGIAGLPGAGKTTLLRLIAGVEKPTEGQVLLDMLPVETWDPHQLARAIGYKPQEAMLFEGTLEANVRAGKDRVSVEELSAAFERGGLRQAIERGELTLSTPVGPRGSFLSGGQRQMVSLARALLGEPAMLLLDEPSTGFDSQLEKALADYIATLAGQRTVILSTHSRVLLTACTRIVVLRQGKIVADGPREKVLVG